MGYFNELSMTPNTRPFSDEGWSLDDRKGAPLPEGCRIAHYSEPGWAYKTPTHSLWITDAPSCERCGGNHPIAACQQPVPTPDPTEPITECAICYHVGPCYGDGEAAICVDRAACRARCDAALDEPTAQPPAPLSPVEALRLALERGVFGTETLAILRASLAAADEEALIKAEQLALAREHAGRTWETWQEERAAGAPF